MNQQDNFDSNDVAIIGMACRFPGAKNVDEFWNNLINGVESFTSISDDELKSLGLSETTINDPAYIKSIPILADVDKFDASFFGFTPREAKFIDPQQRLFLECAWEALENSGYNVDDLNGSVGVYAGSALSTYLLHNIVPNLELFGTPGGLQTLISNDKDYLSSRVAYKLNLKGPAISVQTACSTSLVATHLAYEALISHQCDIALAGGVSVVLPQNKGYLYVEGSVLSKSGHCRAFDAKADGTVFGNGLGVVVLKRLSDAIRDKDDIYCVIKGSSVNNDGSDKVGYTAPSSIAQSKLISEALQVSGIDPADISYIETHGTATTLGDAIEFEGLKRAFGDCDGKKGFCAIGSVKTNIGHLDAAAGIAGLIKTSLALKHKKLPPSLNFKSPNPQIDIEDSPFFVNDKLLDWEITGKLRRAGVSSFGMGGTNAHIILEEPPVYHFSTSKRSNHLLILSAVNKFSLEKLSENLIHYLSLNRNISLEDVAYTLQIGRKLFEHRKFIMCKSIDEAITFLNSDNRQKIISRSDKSTNKNVVFMFSGQGSQYVSMAKELYNSEKVFSENVDLCANILSNFIKEDIRAIIFPNNTDEKEASEKINKTYLTQPALFVIEYSLAKLWIHWGIKPEAMVGHSIGEYVAACLSGVFTLENALAIVAARGRLMQRCPEGDMLMVPLDKNQLSPLLDENQSIAVINGVKNCVVSGTRESIDKLAERLGEKNIKCKQLKTSHAFHSSMMDTALEPFSKEFNKIQLNTPKIPFVSNLTGYWITDQDAINPDYWVKQLRNTVKFNNCLSELLAMENVAFLEVGPGKTLKMLASQHPNVQPIHSFHSSTRHPTEEINDNEFILKTIGELIISGVKFNWSEYYKHEQRVRVSLPTYPFEKQSHWIDFLKQNGQAGSLQTSASVKQDPSKWFYLPTWKRMPVPSIEDHELKNVKSNCLLFIDDIGVGKRIIDRLKEKDFDVITVHAKEKYEKLNERIFSVNPVCPDHFQSLFRELTEHDNIPNRIIHLWGITTPDNQTDKLLTLKQVQNRGFYSLLFLAQAIGNQNITREIRIFNVSNNVYNVIGGESIFPEKATISGPAKVIPKEFPNISCSTIDIDLTELEAMPDENIIDILFNEVSNISREQIVAIRRNNLWIQNYEAVNLKNKSEHRRLRKKGIYLITGGLGGIGLAIAEDLAENFQAKIILLGRTSFPDRKNWDKWTASHNYDDEINQKIRKLKLIEEKGGEILVLSADVTNRTEIEKVIRTIEINFGQLNGIIHAAGIINDGISQLKSVEVAESVLDPKVKGTFILNSVTEGINLDFFAVFSSLNTILAPAGQIDYCAANSFLDVFAQSDSTSEGRFTVSINWPGWTEVGMAARFASKSKARTEIEDLLLKKGVSPKEGVDAFKKILNNDYSNIIISTHDLHSEVEQYIKHKSIENNVKDTDQSDNESLGNAKACEPMDQIEDVQKLLTTIWTEFLGISSINNQDDFFDLGGTSLLAVELFDEIEKLTGIKLPLASLYQAPTIELLSNLLFSASIDRKEKKSKEKEKVETEPLNKHESNELPFKSKIDNLKIRQGEWPCLIPITSKGNKIPLFMVHGAGGNVLLYRDLAKHLGSDQPFYGIQSKGLDGSGDYFERIEEMASHYINEILEIQPEGPYLIGGYCMGGTIAYEMAQQLLASNKTVALVILLDTYNFYEVNRQTFTDQLFYIAQNMNFHIRNLTKLPNKDKIIFVREKTKLAKDRLIERAAFIKKFLNNSLSNNNSLKSLQKINDNAALNYVPKPFNGNLLVVKPEVLFTKLNDPTLGWGNFVQGDLKLIELPLYPKGMLVEPFVRTLSDKLKEEIENLHQVNYAIAKEAD